MTLIACPECSAQVSDQAPHCIRCGYPLAARDATKPQPAAPRPAAKPPTAMLQAGARDAADQCPNCGSTQWQSARLAYAQGTQELSLNGSSVGVGAGASGLGIGVASTQASGSSQSVQAALAAPPPMKATCVVLIFMVMVGLLLAPFTAAGLWLAGGSIVALFYFWPRHRAEHLDQLALWETKRMCMRCGHFYFPRERVLAVTEVQRVAPVVRRQPLAIEPSDASPATSLPQLPNAEACAEALQRHGFCLETTGESRWVISAPDWGKQYLYSFDELEQATQRLLSRPPRPQTAAIEPAGAEGRSG